METATTSPAPDVTSTLHVQGVTYTSAHAPLFWSLMPYPVLASITPGRAPGFRSKRIAHYIMMFIIKRHLRFESNYFVYRLCTCI